MSDKAGEGLVKKVLIIDITSIPRSILNRSERRYDVPGIASIFLWEGKRRYEIV